MALGTLLLFPLSLSFLLLSNHRLYEQGGGGQHFVSPAQTEAVAVPYLLRDSAERGHYHYLCVVLPQKLHVYMGLSSGPMMLSLLEEEGERLRLESQGLPGFVPMIQIKIMLHLNSFQLFDQAGFYHGTQSSKMW